MTNSEGAVIDENSTDKKPLWMPLYVGDYRVDTVRLTTEQHGAYLLLLMDYWQSGPPPDNNAVLARIVGMTAKDWVLMRPILAPFFTIKGGEWRHSRVDKEYQKAMEIVNSMSVKGRKGAAARWGNDGQRNASGIATSNATGIAHANAQAMGNHNHNNNKSKSIQPRGKSGGVE